MLASLAARYAAGPDAAVRAIEGLVQVRIDHLVQVELEGFTGGLVVVGHRVILVARAGRTTHLGA